MSKSGTQIHLGVEARDLFGGCSGVLFSDSSSCILPPWSPDGWLRIHLRAGDRVLLPQSLTPEAPAHCPVSRPTVPVFTGFHEHLSISLFSVDNCSPCALATLPFGKNACFPVLCTLTYSTFEAFLFPLSKYCYFKF